MFKPIDCKRALDRAVDSPAATVLALVVLLAVPVVATSGVATVQPSGALPSTAFGQEPKGTGYQMRCWQHGRLLFEETLTALPTDGMRYTLKVSGNDRHGRPVYIAETSNATCLIRSVTGSAAPYGR